MDLGLKGRVALVTGTGSQVGMGKAIALTLAKEGCSIISCDIDFEGATKTAGEIKALGAKGIVFKTDVAKRADVDSMVAAGLKEFGKIDILVNTVGLTTTGKAGFLQTNEANWQKDVAVNLFGMMNCCQAVLPSMIERKYGKIVNFTSTVATGAGSGSSYGAAKAGVISFSRGLAAEVAPSQINVNIIAPGAVPTGFGSWQKRTPEELKATAARVPLRRLTSVDDIAKAVTFLVSAMSDGIIGNTVTVGAIGI